MTRIDHESGWSSSSASIQCSSFQVDWDSDSRERIFMEPSDESPKKAGLQEGMQWRHKPLWNAERERLDGDCAHETMKRKVFFPPGRVDVISGSHHQPSLISHSILEASVYVPRAECESQLYRSKVDNFNGALVMIIGREHEHSLSLAAKKKRTNRHSGQAGQGEAVPKMSYIELRT